MIINIIILSSKKNNKIQKTVQNAKFDGYINYIH